jgi:signal transduction histidine kinase
MSEQSLKVLGALIRSEASEIERRWVDRARREIRNLGLDQRGLKDGIQYYLATLAATLSGEEQVETWAEVARQHGVTRVRQGFDIQQLVREFAVLRRVIGEVMGEHGLTSFELATAMADHLSTAVSESVASYVAWRDYESRRMEARHIGFITHELRNPLSNAILAAARLRSIGPDAKAAEILERNLGQLTKLIDSLLDHERLRSGVAEAHPAETELGELIEGAATAARSEAARKGLRFDLNYQRERLRLDPALTKSILTNLFDNAVKYTDHGSVVVDVEDRPDEVVIHVRDTCPGLSPEEQAVIFTPYRRGAHAGKRPGTGLGLAIAAAAAKAQGGSIGVESHGPGCHFWAVLPRQVAAPSPQPSAP